jgi:hypothetical protein
MTDRDGFHGGVLHLPGEKVSDLVDSVRASVVVSGLRDTDVIDVPEFYATLRVVGRMRVTHSGKFGRN